MARESLAREGRGGNHLLSSTDNSLRLTRTRAIGRWPTGITQMFAALLYVSYESFKLHQTCTMGPILSPPPSFSFHPTYAPLPLSISTFGLKIPEDKRRENRFLSSFLSLSFFLLPSSISIHRCSPTPRRSKRRGSATRATTVRSYKLLPTILKRVFLFYKFIRERGSEKRRPI